MKNKFNSLASLIFKINSWIIKFENKYLIDRRFFNNNQPNGNFACLAMDGLQNNFFSNEEFSERHVNPFLPTHRLPVAIMRVRNQWFCHLVCIYQRNASTSMYTSTFWLESPTMFEVEITQSVHSYCRLSFASRRGSELFFLKYAGGPTDYFDSHGLRSWCPWGIPSFIAFTLFVICKRIWTFSKQLLSSFWIVSVVAATTCIQCCCVVSFSIFCYVVVRLHP